MPATLDRPRARAVGAKRNDEPGRLPKPRRNDMMLVLYEAGYPMEDIARFTREDAHYSTVSRAVAALS